MSNGYTNAFAMTAPAEPAMALPHGGNASTLDCPAIVCVRAVRGRRRGFRRRWGRATGEQSSSGSWEQRARAAGCIDKLSCRRAISWPRRRCSGGGAGGRKLDGSRSVGNTARKLS